MRANVENTKRARGCPNRLYTSVIIGQLWKLSPSSEGYLNPITQTEVVLSLNSDPRYIVILVKSFGVQDKDELFHLKNLLSYVDLFFTMSCLKLKDTEGKLHNELKRTFHSFKKMYNITISFTTWILLFSIESEEKFL